VDLLLGDEALGLGLAHVGLALVIHDHEADLGAAQTRQAGGLAQGQVQGGAAIIDDLDGHLDSADGVDAHLGHRARQRVEDSDHDFLGGLGLRGRERRERHESQGEQSDRTSHHGDPPLRLD